MKKIGLFMLFGISFGCKSYICSNKESVALTNFKPQIGVHCESSALLNALNHQGYNLTENEILGAGAVLAFVFQKGEFPFLGGRTLKLKENLFNTLEIKWHIGTLDNESHGWDKIHKLLNDDTPVILRVDMRFLPYLHDGKYGSKYTSFGWHIITIVSIDTKKQIAYVTDTSKDGLQEIKLNDLQKARFSKLDVMPPQGEYYWIEQAPTDFKINWEEVTKKSLKTIKRDMLRIYETQNDLVGLNGMKELSINMRNLGQSTPSYLIESVLGFLYGSIETNGTGGAAFREQYLLFLQERSVIYGEFNNYAILLSESVKAWDSFSDYLKSISIKNSIKDYEKLSQLANSVYLAEKKFYMSIEQL